MQPNAGSASNTPRVGWVPQEAVADAFDAGPYRWLPTALVPRCRASRRVWRDALLTAVVSWVPLAILAAIQGHAVSGDAHESLLLDAGAYGRYLVASPLFVLAGSVYLPRLGFTVRQFVDAGVIADRDLAEYNALVASTRRLLASHWTDAALLCVAYAATLTLAPSPGQFSTWVTPASGGSSHLSLAGWWRTLVSQPLFFGLVASWLWRLLLWARFLWRVGRMDLRLVAAHPDRLGGLRFLSLPLGGFLILAFALGVVTASSIAGSVIFDGRTLADFMHLLGAQVSIVLVMFAGPPLLLMPSLLRLQYRGTITYGRLASQLGRMFEEKWIASGRPVRSEALGASDFSATTDLFSIVANVRAINPFVVDVRSIVALAVATLLPHALLALAVLPFDEVMRVVLKAIT